MLDGAECVIPSPAVVETGPLSPLGRRHDFLSQRASDQEWFAKHVIVRRTFVPLLRSAKVSWKPTAHVKSHVSSVEPWQVVCRLCQLW